MVSKIVTSQTTIKDWGDGEMNYKNLNKFCTPTASLKKIKIGNYSLSKNMLFGILVSEEKSFIPYQVISQCTVSESCCKKVPQTRWQNKQTKNILFVCLFICSRGYKFEINITVCLVPFQRYLGRICSTFLSQLLVVDSNPWCSFVCILQYLPPSSHDYFLSLLSPCVWPHLFLKGYQSLNQGPP